MSDSVTHPYQGHLLQPAFEGFVSFAAKNRQLIGYFLDEHPECKPPTGKLELMIDKATGRDKAVFQEFVNWCLKKFGTPDQIMELEE